MKSPLPKYMVEILLEQPIDRQAEELLRQWQFHGHPDLAHSLSQWLTVNPKVSCPAQHVLWCWALSSDPLPAPHDRVINQAWSIMVRRAFKPFFNINRCRGLFQMFRQALEQPPSGVTLDPRFLLNEVLNNARFMALPSRHYLQENDIMEHLQAIGVWVIENKCSWPQEQENWLPLLPRVRAAHERALLHQHLTTLERQPSPSRKF